MYERLRLSKALPERFQVLRSCVPLEIKDLMRSGILKPLGRLLGRLRRFWLIFSLHIVLCLFLVIVFKIIYQIQKKIQEELLYPEGEFAPLETLEMSKIWICRIVLNIFEFICFLNIILKFLDHERNLGLRLRRQGLLVQNSLSLQIKHNNIFVHALPPAGKDFVPKLLWHSDQERKWSIQVIDERRREGGQQCARPLKRIQKREHSLYERCARPSITIDNNDFAFM